MDLYRFLWVLFVVYCVIYIRMENVGGDSCEYNFQVWQPGKDVLRRLQALESKKEAVTNQAIILKLHEQLLAYQNGLLASQNATAEIMQHVANLKLEDALIRNDQKNMALDILKFQTAWTNLQREAQALVTRVDAIKRCEADKKLENKGLQNKMSLVDVTLAKHQNALGNLKGEWVLVKRDVDALKVETISMKFGQNSLKDSIGKLEKMFCPDLKQVDSHEKEILLLKESSRKLVEEVTTLKSMFDSKFSHRGKGEIMTRPAVRKPRDCHDHVLNGHSTSGVYQISPRNSSLTGNVYCEILHKSAGLTGWTLLQRRIDGLINFNRGWSDYKYGFGNPYGEFWIGNEWLHYLSQQKDYLLRIDMWDWEGRYYYAQYHEFRVGDDQDRYVIHIKDYHGNAGDSFSISHNVAFSTSDSDNDMSKKNCAAEFKSGWWFKSCGMSNLNGRYQDKETNSRTDGISWYTIKESDYYSLKKVEMKIKPRNHRHMLKPGS